MNVRHSIVAASSLLFFAACAAPPADSDIESSEDDLRTAYGDLRDTLGGSDLDDWYSVASELKAGFDRICGDTICGGDYSNLTTVRLACSSTRAALKMKDCLWVLAGNIDYVDGRTGKLTSELRTFACHVPVNSNARAFVGALHAAGRNALDTTVPGTQGTFYDALVSCFSGVVAPPPPQVPQTFYVELEENQWNQGEAQGSAWWETKHKLASGFDDACGDAFCEGEYPDIVALRLACSVNQKSQRVSRCGWSFAGAELSVDSRGQLSARTMTKRCDFAVGATASELQAALAGDDPLHATLPKSSASIYEKLIGCL